MTQEELKQYLLQTGARISHVSDDNNWVKYYFEILDCELLVKVGQVVKSLFYNEGRYTHLLPKFIGEKGQVVLLIDNKLLHDTTRSM